MLKGAPGCQRLLFVLEGLEGLSFMFFLYFFFFFLCDGGGGDFLQGCGISVLSPLMCAHVVENLRRFLPDEIAKEFLSKKTVALLLLYFFEVNSIQ